MRGSALYRVPTVHLLLLTLRQVPHTLVFPDTAAPHPTAPSSFALLQASPCACFRVIESRDGGGRAGTEGQESAGGGGVGLGFLLGILEVATAQQDLLSRLEGWHPKVGAVGTSESISQVAISTG